MCEDPTYSAQQVAIHKKSLFKLCVHICMYCLTWLSTEQFQHHSLRRFYQKEQLLDPSTGQTSPAVEPEFTV